MAETIGLKAVFDTSQFTKGLNTYNAGLGKANSATSGFTSKLAGIGKVALGATVAGLAAVTAGLVAFGASAVKEGQAFTKEMSNVGAISGATASQFAQLEQQAMSLGATTKFTATEAAEAMGFLAMAGFDVNAIMGAMPGVLDLAAASNLDLGRSADIVSNILSGFGEDTSQTGRYVDLLTKTFTTSNTSLEQLGQAMKFVAPVADSLGFSAEQTAAALGILGNAGIQAGNAGRGLRGVMSKLANPTGAAAATIKELGIETFNLDGTMKTLPEIIGQFNKATADMTQEQRAAALGTIFSRGEISNMLVLMDAGQDTLEQFGRTLEGSAGTAAEIAAKQLDNLAGDVTLFQSALSGVKIDVFKQMEPVLRSAVQTATKSLPKIGNILNNILIPAFQRIVEVIGKVSGAFGRFGVRGASISILGMLGFDPNQIGQVMGFVDQVIAIVNRVTTAFQNFGFRGASVSILGLLGFDPSQISEVLTLFDSIQTEVVKLVTNIVGIFGIAAQGATSFSWVDLIANSITFINQNFEMFRNIVLGIGAAFGAIAIVGTVAGIIAAINPLTVAILGIGTVIGIVATAWTQNWGNIQAIAQTAVTTLSAVWAGITTGLQPAMASFQQLGAQLQALGITWPVVFQAILVATQIVGAAIGVILLGVVSLVTGFANAWASVLTLVVPIFTQLTAAVSMFVGGILQLLQGNLLEGWTSVVTAIGLGTSALFTGMFDIIIAATRGFIEGVVGFWQGLYQTLVGGSIVPDIVHGIIDLFNFMVSPVISSIVSMTAQAVSIFTSFIGKAEELFSIEKFVKMGANVIKGLVQGIKENANKVVAALGDVLQSAIDAVLERLGISSPSTVFAGFGGDIISGLILGLKSQSGALQEDITTIADEAIKGFMEVLGKGAGTNTAGMRRFTEYLHTELEHTIRDGLSGQNIDIQSIMDDLSGTMMQNFDGAIVSQDMANQMAQPMFDAMQKAFGPVLKKIGQEIATKLAASAGQFLSLGQTAAKRMIDPLEQTLQEISDKVKEQGEVTFEYGGNTTTVKGALDRINELRELQSKSFSQERQDELDALNKQLTFGNKNNALVRERLALLFKEQQAQKELEVAKEKQLRLEKQQADLQFLQQQLGLLQTIRELGLDPTKILKGIKLGLDADLGKLADAMGDVVQGIVDQVDNTLQIASPSKVMIDRGQQVVAGLMQGIQSYASNLKQSVGGLMQGGLVNGPNVSTQSSPVTNNNSRSVTIGPIYTQNNGMTPQQLQQFIKRTVMNPI